MRIMVRYLYNNTSNSPIEKDSEIMYFDDYSYEEIEEDVSKEKELSDLIAKTLKQKYGYVSVKVTGLSEL